MKLAYWALIPIICFVGYRVLEVFKDTVLPGAYIFDPKVLQALAQEALAENEDPETPNVIFEALYKKLVDKYGDSIEEYSKDRWMFSNAGGAMGTFIILHASLTEYLIIFGSPIGTEGHTGHHLADDYFIILSGIQRAAYPGQTIADAYHPGDLNYLPYGLARQYSLSAEKGGFALELAQGYIPTMLIFGFADSVFSTVDPFNLYRQINFTARSIIGNLLRGKI